MAKRLLVITLLFFVQVNCLLAFDGGNPVAEYINKWSEQAIKNMRKYGIPASITLAQAIRECGAGNSKMARLANNHFGVKCFGWQGEKYMTGKNGKGSCYRAYTDAAESFEDHAKILSGMKRYAFLFKLDKLDYKSWAKGLKKAGYASQKTYPQLLIKIIEEHQLYLLDQRALKAPLINLPKIDLMQIELMKHEPKLRSVSK